MEIKHDEWHYWFAWHPVLYWYTPFGARFRWPRWFVWVQRKRVPWPGYGWLWPWEYAAINPEFPIEGQNAIAQSGLHEYFIPHLMNDHRNGA